MFETLEIRRLFALTITTGPDPRDASLTAIFVQGDAADDGISMNVGGSGVIVNGTTIFAAPRTARVFVDGGDGNDLIAFGNGFANGQGQARGGNGEDQLIAAGNAGACVLIGGADADRIVGANGADVLIGGGASDNMDGGGGSDIVIGPVTVYDDNTASNQAALCDIVKEWTGKGNFNSHISHLTNGGGANGSTLLRTGTEVTGDSAADDLSGGKGSNVFYAATSGPNHDVISDRRPTLIIGVLD